MLVKCMWMLFVLDIMGEMAFVTLALLFAFFLALQRLEISDGIGRSSGTHRWTHTRED